mmetsp:Transcript_101284/g.285561  ORF Transcript_101284/g.285561 Transcript_101284/m.285561 type:complete len:306 (+) Transcript_101284:39-956(+)
MRTTREAKCAERASVGLLRLAGADRRLGLGDAHHHQRLVLGVPEATFVALKNAPHCADDLAMHFVQVRVLYGALLLHLNGLPPNVAERRLQKAEKRRPPSSKDRAAEPQRSQGGADERRQTHGLVDVLLAKTEARDDVKAVFDGQLGKPLPVKHHETCLLRAPVCEVHLVNATGQQDHVLAAANRLLEDRLGGVQTARKKGELTDAWQPEGGSEAAPTREDTRIQRPPIAYASREGPANAVDAMRVHGEKVTAAGVRLRALADASGVVVAQNVIAQPSIKEPFVRPALRQVRSVEEKLQRVQRGK